MQISEHLTHMKIHPNDTIPISWLMPDGASSWPEETRKPDLERLKKEPLTLENYFELSQNVEHAVII